MKLAAMIAGLVLALAACTAPPTASGPSTASTAQAVDQGKGTKIPEYDPAKAPPQSQAPQVDAAACSAKGGTVQRVCLMGNPMCIVPHKDGGKSCTSSSQCEGRCQIEASVQQGKPATGKCTANNQPCGCFQTVENGVAQPALCVD